jgi:hypothetical protein
MRKSLFVITLLLIPASLFAQDWRNRRSAPDRYDRYNRLEDKFEITPFVGYAWGGTIYADQTSLFNQDVDVASSANFGASFAVPLREGFKIELLADRQNTHLETGGGNLFEPNNTVANFDITYYQAGLQIPFAVSRNVKPFVVVSAGVANLDPRINGVSSSTRFAASVGLGVKIPINPQAGFRADIRGFYTSLGNNGCSDCYFGSYGYNNYLSQGQANVGFYFAF